MVVREWIVRQHACTDPARNRHSRIVLCHLSHFRHGCSQPDPVDYALGKLGQAIHVDLRMAQPDHIGPTPLFAHAGRQQKAGHRIAACPDAMCRRHMPVAVYTVGTQSDGYCK